MKILYAAHGHYWGSTYPYAFIDFYIANTLKALGHEVIEFNVFERTVPLVEYYKGLAKQHNLNNSQLLGILDDRATAALPAEILEYEPDLVFHIVGRIPQRILKIIRKIKTKTAIWYLDDPQEINFTSKAGLLYDQVFTVEPNCVNEYHEAGIKTAAFVPLGCFDPIFKPLEVEEKYKSDLCFIGVPFPARVDFFDSIADRIKDYNVKIIGGGPTIGDSSDPWMWKRKLKRLDVLGKFILDEVVFPEEAVKYYNGAKINLNVHRHSQDVRILAGNPKNIYASGVSGRTFEIAGCSAFQLIDSYRTNVSEQFEVGKEIISFSDNDDLMKKIEYYLKHEDERKNIAAEAFKKTISRHTYQHRINSILSSI